MDTPGDPRKIKEKEEICEFFFCQQNVWCVSFVRNEYELN